ncbi:peptidase S8/S53 domain-containing protein [Clohesyomyces aquaticus]|uniref:Peptidase S8/S53 domain-containing protein n=1 Tax=Clohesyomyces aquaticus TaxID=1231657 RepID=A0A1Y1ZVX2_9PLEO|nr:peptidase S8/S53 domain-containing protein [Clohesyomyces aquaticus]
MRSPRSISTIALLVVAVVATPIPDTHVVHEKRGLHSRSADASPWIKRGRLQPDKVLPVRVALAQQNIYRGEEWLLDLSHPASSNYGKHWTIDQVIEAFQPTEETVGSVRKWLVDVGGIASNRIVRSENKGWLAFDATIAEAEGLLHTEFHEYKHRQTGHAIAACDQYHVPKHVQRHIDYITPGIRGARISQSLQKRGFRGGKSAGWLPPKIKPTAYRPQNDSDLSKCDVVITPACLRALYEIPPQEPNVQVNPDNSLGIFEEGDFYSQQDLDLFFANFTPYIPAGTRPIPRFIDGANAPVPVRQAGSESALDFELVYPIIYPQTTTLYQVDDDFYSGGFDRNATGIFNTFLDALDGSYCTYSAYGEAGNDPVLDPTYPHPSGYNGSLQCGVYKPTNVISISYGEQEQDLPAYYQQRQCNEFLKLGLQGVSIFVASGDNGVGGIPGGGAANGCLGPDAAIFSPTQPNSCPWLTNVGGTKVYPGKSVFDPESAVLDPAGQPYRYTLASGGGFSNIFTIPDYQQKAVSTFFQEHNPPYPYYVGGNYSTTQNGLYNRNGRGIPDVAANSDNIATFTRGKFITSGGTSASAPIFAAIINRIVEERLKIGKGPLGFINPVLYSHPEVLNDITNGTNPGCGTDGFSAVKGWDPVTGLGTPNYPKMLNLFLHLP